MTASPTDLPKVRGLAPSSERELVVDSFAGGGGASVGIEAALGRPVDVAINHDPEAIAMHAANHPGTRHYCEDVWAVDPREACAGRPVGLAWFSPECTHFSRARGTGPLKRQSRSLAWVVVRWAREVRPRVLALENVEEFASWGPLDDGRPDKARAGETFRAWLAELRALGYAVEWRSLVAADYGAPTVRRRLYLVARCDGAPIAWPAPTHGEGRTRPWREAREVIEWHRPCRSIFARPRPLADATLRRIAEGIHRFVLGARQPFVVRHGHYSKRTGAGLIPGRGAGTWRGQPLGIPLATVCATNDKNLVVPRLEGDAGEDARLDAWLEHGPLAEALVAAAPIAGDGGREDAVLAFLMKYYGSGGRGQDVRDPLHTVTAKARFGLVEVAGRGYHLTDVGMRMLVPAELYRAQGFPDGYDHESGPGGRRLTQAAQIRMAGNSVCPPVAEAIVRALASLPSQALAQGAGGDVETA